MIRSWLRIGTVLCGLAAFALAGTAQSADKLPEVSTDGLHLVKQTDFGAVYVKPGATFGEYDKVAVLECFLAIQRGWAQNMNTDDPLSVTPETIKRIKASLAAEFMKVFKQQLNAGGYPVMDDAAKDVLVLRPAIVNLQIQAPDPMGNAGTVYARNAGQMTLYLELYDSISSDLLARVIDREVAENMGDSFGWQNAGSNFVAADTILKKWADRLMEYLNAARGAG